LYLQKLPEPFYFDLTFVSAPYLKPIYGKISGKVLVLQSAMNQRGKRLEALGESIPWDYIGAVCRQNSLEIYDAKQLSKAVRILLKSILSN